MADRKHIQELATRTVIAMAAGAGNLAGPDAAAAATALTPIAEDALNAIVRVVGSRRRDHAAETLADAAEAAGVSTDEEFAEFLANALSDDRKQELLARALIIAQDSAMRDKRRAIGRSIAAAMTDMGTRVDEELIFLRALDNLDAPHFRLLWMMAEISSGQAVPTTSLRGWRPSGVGIIDEGLKDTARTLLTGLEQYGLIQSDGEDYAHPWIPKRTEPEYEVTDYGYWFLKRLREHDDVSS
jgi:hypothetical protein